MARKKEKVSNPLLDYLDLSIKKQKGGGAKVPYKKDKRSFYNIKPLIKARNCSFNFIITKGKKEVDK